MTPAFRLLLWAAVLVGWSVLVLDWRDDVIRLQPERARVEQLRAREQSALLNVNWPERFKDAKAAQEQWLDRFPRVAQIGVFRAQALEGISDLCKQVEAQCQVSSLGENVTTPGKGNPDGLSGVVAAGVRVVVPLQGKQFELLLSALESDAVLRRVDKVVVRSGRATLDVQSYGLLAGGPDAARPVAVNNSNPGNSSVSNGNGSASNEYANRSPSPEVRP